LKNFMLAAVAAISLVGCGGGDPGATPVELCVAGLRPAVLACLGPDYRGITVPACARELAAHPSVVACREQGVEEFVVLADQQFGHEARRVLRGAP
jgi:hypothetical protein